MSEDEIVGLDEALVKRQFGSAATPEFMNMLRLGKAAYEHGYHEVIPRRKVMEWVGRMYSAGQAQGKIKKGRMHGNIFINSADVVNAGAYLDLYGKREGLLSK